MANPITLQSVPQQSPTLNIHTSSSQQNQLQVQVSGVGGNQTISPNLKSQIK
jgi:hypothetical protein